ncbi:hypothetical protein AK812_SmicGene3775 [Symbiodinium microadriaticum]|uniref:THIF-type NAD/FAD binding fold domain-containing protein n=1 Tax=Symbiodinium microadriaticum TaxID=2951 RepID=A0A1Q9EXV7_SYMMI|nr:hypothetical protein AK812_SmicGene3775 [Symbiodinium microadriaticum]
MAAAGPPGRGVSQSSHSPRCPLAASSIARATALGAVAAFGAETLDLPCLPSGAMPADPLVVVVGLGGVGGHCAHALLRSGLRRLRLIDFDRVSLSSLNRHAVALRRDVGVPKVTACAQHFRAIRPDCQIEVHVELLAFCVREELPVVSALGSGAKDDPTQICVAKGLRDIDNDPLATKLRKICLAQGLSFDEVSFVYSSQKVQRSLLPLSEEQRANPEAFGSVANFRLRVIPVLGTQPAAAGLAIAAEGFGNFVACKMSISVSVGLLSGKTATVKAALDEEVGALKQQAQLALGVGRGRLLDSFGNVISECVPIKNAKIQNGDSLTLHINQVHVQVSYGAVAASLADGSVVAWGPASSGGDCSAARDQLSNVQQIQSCGFAFAAILGDGSVVTWGDATRGADSSAVQAQLKNVQHIHASDRAFAAILGDGSVVTWGSADSGGDSTAVQAQLKNVQQIQASSGSFAAILCDGSVVTWGDADYGGDSSAVQEQLKNVQQIQAARDTFRGAFAAILGDGSVVTWGSADHGGDSISVQAQLKNVQQIQASESAFAAVIGDGSVVTWGDASCGGDSSSVQAKLKNVQQIQASGQAFAAVLSDGSVVTWGAANYGGDSHAVQHQLTNVHQVQATRDIYGGAFAAILADGSVVTWGDAEYGGDSSAVQGQLKNVQQIQATDLAFAAILSDGSVVTWGDAWYGGDSSAVQDQLKDVQQIQATLLAFAAIRGDGSVVTWGNDESGGDSSAVQDQLRP